MQVEPRSNPRQLSLFAGYLPLVVVGLVVTGMVWAFPSQAPDGNPNGGAGGGTGAAEEDTGTTASGWGDSVEYCSDIANPQDDLLDYSPPCFSFSGDNGGETAHGVTEDSIRVSYRYLDTGHFIETLAQVTGNSLGETPGDLWRTAEALVDYFNENFEFYGREIELIQFEGAGNLLDELQVRGQQNATIDARSAADRNVFADAMAVSQNYAEELSAEGIVNIGAPYMSRAWFDEHWPYAWSPFPDCSLIVDVAADIMDQRLLDEPVLIGEFRGDQRVLGGVHPSNDQYQRCGDDFETDMADRGYGDMPERQTYPLDFGQANQNAGATLDNLMRDGVTTVGFVGDPMTLVELAAQAEQRSYQPEWVVGGVGFVDMDVVGQAVANASGDQWTRSIGISPTGTPVAVEEMDAYAAFKSVRPDEEPTAALEFMYSLLLPLALGIQMAGPDLTPETFADGLYRYPRTDGWMGLRDYSPDVHSGLVDVRLMFWDPDSPSPFNGQPGTWADTGQRFTDVDQAPTQSELATEMEEQLEDRLE